MLCLCFVLHSERLDRKIVSQDLGITVTLSISVRGQVQHLLRPAYCLNAALTVTFYTPSNHSGGGVQQRQQYFKLRSAHAKAGYSFSCAPSNFSSSPKQSYSLRCVFTHKASWTHRDWPVRPLCLRLHPEQCSERVLYLLLISLCSVFVVNRLSEKWGTHNTK